MDDRDQQDGAIGPGGTPVRAKTLVVRCWHERSDAGIVLVRGSVRDLSRGRASAFEGFAALAEQLQRIIGDADAS